MSEITFKELPDNVTEFSCGCRTQVIGGNYVISPCSPECRVYRYVVEQTKAEGKILTYHVDETAR